MYPGIGDEKLKPILTQKNNFSANEFKKLAMKGNVRESEYLESMQTSLNQFS